MDLRQDEGIVVVVEGDGGDLVLVAETGEHAVEGVNIDPDIVAVDIEVAALFALEQGMFYQGGLAGLADTVDLVGVLILQVVTPFYILGGMQVLSIKLF